jgi:hypothetical protein
MKGGGVSILSIEYSLLIKLVNIHNLTRLGNIDSLQLNGIVILNLLAKSRLLRRIKWSLQLKWKDYNAVY